MIQKIAYLITAYKDTKHLCRLINSLNDEDNFFYVHIDKKVDIHKFTDKINFNNVKFIDKRYYINWGGWSQVESIVELMKNLFESNKIYDRVVLISGQDYPIFSNKKIKQEFANNPDKEYLIGYNLTNDNITKQKNRINKYYFFDISNVLIRRIIKAIFLYILPLKKKKQVFFLNKWNDVYFGSDYWALTYQCAKYVYETWVQESKLRRYIKTCFVPSEIFVQTIVLNADYKKNATIFEKEYQGLSYLTALHYIEYSGSIKVFNKKDYDKLIKSGKMFFRKSESGYSDKLMDRIDEIRNLDK